MFIGSTPALNGRSGYAETVHMTRRLPVVETIYDQFRDAAAEVPHGAFLCYPSSGTRGYCSDGVEFT